MTRSDQTQRWQATQNSAAPQEVAVDAYFSSLGRDGLEELEHESNLLRDVPLLQDILDAMPIAVSILNDKGQIILVNRPWSESHGSGPDCGLGKRHGELLGCINADEGPDGCGTSRYCERCGAAISIMASQRLQSQVAREYRLTREAAAGPAAKDLLVTSTPIRVEGRNYTVFAVHEPPA